MTVKELIKALRRAKHKDAEIRILETGGDILDPIVTVDEGDDEYVNIVIGEPRL